MKAALTLLMTGMILLAVLTGCDSRTLNIPTNPTQVSQDDADRVLAFRYKSASAAGGLYSIAMYDNGTKTRDVDDSVVELAIGDSLIELIYMNHPPWKPGWFSSADFLVQNGQTIKLTIDGQIVLNTVIKTVYKSSVAFPGSYDYEQSLNLNWAVTAGNQYQFVRAESWPLDEVGNIYPHSKYVRQLAANTRSHRFPANCVMVAGTLENTVFGLIVQQVNYKVVGKTAVMVYQEEGSSYQGSGTRLENDLTRDAALEIHEQLSGR